MADLLRSPLFQLWGRKAIRADDKRQTRRIPSRMNSLLDGLGFPMKGDMAFANFDVDAAVVDAGPSPAGNAGPYLKVPNRVTGTTHRVYPHGQPGDVWGMREPLLRSLGGWCFYKDDERLVWVEHEQRGWQWKRDTLTSLFMPLWAARTFRTITDVRVERVQDISYDDAAAEGVTLPPGELYPNINTGSKKQDEFMRAWDRINAKRPGCAWADNPWNFVYTFRPATAAEVENAKQTLRERKLTCLNQSK